MANRYWVGGTPRNDWQIGPPDSNWSLESGGVNGAPEPTEEDIAVFDENSGDGESMISQHITIKALDTTGYRGTFRIASNVRLNLLEGESVLSGSMSYVADDAYAYLVKSEDASIVVDDKHDVIIKEEKDEVIIKGE